MKQVLSYTIAALVVSLQAADLDVSKYAPNAQTLLNTLQQKFPGTIVPTFVQNGGKLTVITFRPQAGDPRTAVYDQIGQQIKLRKGADGKIDFTAMDDMAHEFWHAYWHQVASKGETGPDAATFRVFVATRDWLKKQKIELMTDGEAGPPPAKWKNEGWEEFTDEYIAGALNLILQTHRRLADDVDSKRRTLTQVQQMWQSFLNPKPDVRSPFDNLSSYRESVSPNAFYQVRGCVLKDVPQLGQRLAELFGAKF